MPVAAQEVVQGLPDPATEELNDALRRLSSNPRNVSAMVAAGNASLQLGDTRAALSFFNRAQAIRPDDARVLVGLALIAVRRGEGPTAVQLFDNADNAGSPMSPYAAERGLAYDLVGNNARAQRLYRQALSREASDEVVRRLALSYAISGDGAASEATLLPLLQRQDRRAFRTRTFALAILGRDQEALSIAEVMLPPRLSQRLSPYLQYMPRLTPAQQAAAANLGRFPVLDRIGQDSPQVAALGREAAPPATPPVQGSDDRLTPSGAPLGPARPVTQPTAELPAVASASTGSAAVPAPPARAPSPVVAATMAEERIADAAPAVAPPPEEIARPSFSITEADPEPAPEQLALADAFADFTLPGRAMPTAAQEGAVDITAIQAAREAPAPAAPTAPSRHWVQVATGQDVSAFRFDWRRIVRNAGGLLDGREPFTARWNETNRLLTGPFESRSAAQAFVTELGEAGVDAFRFTSADGEVVRAVD